MQKKKEWQRKKTTKNKTFFFSAWFLCSFFFFCGSKKNLQSLFLVISFFIFAFLFSPTFLFLFPSPFFFFFAFLFFLPAPSFIMDSQPDFTEPSQKGVQMRLIGAIVFGVILIVLIFCIGIAVGRASKDSSSSNNDQSPSSPPPPPPHTNVPSNEFFLQKWGANDTDGALNYLTPEVRNHGFPFSKRKRKKFASLFYGYSILIGR